MAYNITLSSSMRSNLLTGGDLNIIFNESRVHSFTVKGKDIRTDKIGLATKTWNYKNDIEMVLKEINKAISLASQSAKSSLSLF